MQPSNPCLEKFSGLSAWQGSCSLLVTPIPLDDEYRTSHIQVHTCGNTEEF